LIEATQTAANHGVFGVPSLRINQQIFWGVDSIDWVLEYLNKPDMFSEKEFQKTESIINPLLEK
jgi:hypothetical protein